MQRFRLKEWPSGYSEGRADLVEFAPPTMENALPSWLKLIKADIMSETYIELS